MRDLRAHTVGAGDFASLYQKPRETAAEQLFLPGLRASNVWYGHEFSVCWMQTELPAGFSEQMAAAGLAVDYNESGWCFVEAAISAGLKMGTRRLDLAKRTEEAMCVAYGGAYVPHQKLESVCAAARTCVAPWRKGDFRSTTPVAEGE